MKKRSDVTDQDETWCLVKCAPKSRAKEPLAEQCPHKDARGQYVVRVKGAWYFFEPATRMQALSWVNGRPERHRRIHWLCYECGEIMPLASYSMKGPAEQQAR